MSEPRADRRIHAVLPDGVLLVRYDRSGKWYLEPPTGRRRALTLPQAVDAARGADVVHLDVPGGRQFDAMLRRAGARTP